LGSDDDVQQRAESDRREVDPPIQVETATWSKAGQLDWWVKGRQEWWGGCAGKTVVNGGFQLLIFVPPRASDRQGDCGGSFFLRYVNHSLAWRAAVGLTVLNIAR
jgi:hypothetical protein